jgi:bifunctional oligoribonuclease and PAP phosphatase NrnA
MENEFKNLIESSDSILVTSHISPDPDATASLLLVGTTLMKNFPDKVVTMVLEEKPLGLDFLEGYEAIEFKPLLAALQELQPDLLILLDGNNYDRASRFEGEEVRQYIKENSVKVVIIDHHELAGKDEADVFINQESPATAQTVYELLFRDMGLVKPTGAAQTAMVGFYADTGGFVYLKDGGQGKTFSFAEELVTQGANVEQVKNQLSQYSEADMQAISELAANVSHQDDYSFSYLSDELINKWLASGNTQAQLQRATGTFLDEFIRNIDGRQWGFIVYRNTLQGDNIYSVSLRAVNGVKDVAAIANKLGGGGHKAAAGAKLEADSVISAIEKVKAAILEP